MQQSSDIYVNGDTVSHLMADVNGATGVEGREDGGEDYELYREYNEGEGEGEGYMQGEGFMEGQGYMEGQAEGQHEGMQDDEEMCHGIFSTKDSGISLKKFNLKFCTKSRLLPYINSFFLRIFANIS